MNTAPKKLYAHYVGVWIYSDVETVIIPDAEYIHADRVALISKLSYLQGLFNAQTEVLTFSERDPNALLYQITKIKEQLQ